MFLLTFILNREQILDTSIPLLIKAGYAESLSFLRRTISMEGPKLGSLTVEDIIQRETNLHTWAAGGKVCLVSITLETDVPRVFVGAKHTYHMESGRPSGMNQYGYGLERISHDNPWSKIILHLYYPEKNFWKEGLKEFLSLANTFIHTSRVTREVQAAIKLMQHNGGAGAIRRLERALRFNEQVLS